MTRFHLTIALIAALACGWTGVFPSLAQTPDAATTGKPSLTLHVYECELANGDVDACHDRPMTSAEVAVQGDDVHAAPTDETGTVVFSLAPGTWSVASVNDITDVTAQCTWSGPRGDGPADYPVVLEGEHPNAECDVYVVTGMPGGADQPAATATATDVASTPSTGTPEVVDSYTLSIIEGGSCNPGEGDQIVHELNPATFLNGKQDGSPSALTMGASTTTLDVPISEFVNGDYSVIVTDADDPSTILGCAPIGGVKDELGGYAFVLGSMPDSTVSGAVYVSPQDSGTKITVFITPNHKE